MKKDAKTFAEHAFYKWMEKEELSESHFRLEMVGKREAILFDSNDDGVRLVYSPETKHVRAVDWD